MKVTFAAVVLVTLCYVGGVWSETNELSEWNERAADNSVSLVRVERDTNKQPNKQLKKNKKAKWEKGGDSQCKYVKAAWGECDPKTNLRTRTLTLKKGDQAACEATKTIQKKCKKGKQSCQYDKGTWSACTPQNQMTRTDRLKAGSDASCEATRQVTRPCKTKQAANKAKGSTGTGTGRRNRQ